MNTPIYIIEETKLRRNLAFISDVAAKADIEIILAFKAFALWKTFPIFREYINSTTASSLGEARLALEEFGAPAHTYSPAYTPEEFPEIVKCSSHLTFNSLSQYERFHNQAKGVSLGLRVNPSDVFQRTLVHIEEKFSKWFPQLKWINFGGGHLMTRKDYDVELLIRLMQDFHKRYPWLKVILEPGSAFAWQTGPLVSHVVDIVEDKGIRTAILDVSFTCHMPDCLEMPYMPEVRGAEIVEVDENNLASDEIRKIPHLYRLGGNSCLSGDFMSSWRFDHELEIGEEVIFEDMIHYTTVKTCTFNGISHPSIGMLHSDGQLEVLRRFGYEDYRNRMD